MLNSGFRYEVHIAAIPEDGEQICVRCGVVLLSAGDRDFFRPGDQISVAIGSKAANASRRIIGSRELAPGEKECERREASDTPFGKSLFEPSPVSGTDDSFTGTYTEAPPSDVPPMTLESLEQIMLQFTDRRPATVRAVKIHPDYRDVFFASLREEGVKVIGHAQPLGAVEILLDAAVAYGKIEYVYAGDGH